MVVIHARVQYTKFIHVEGLVFTDGVVDARAMFRVEQIPLYLQYLNTSIKLQEIFMFLCKLIPVLIHQAQPVY